MATNNKDAAEKKTAAETVAPVKSASPAAKPADSAKKTAVVNRAEKEKDEPVVYLPSRRVWPD